MRGLTHFMMGITVATFFKSLMVGAVAQDSLLIILGGIFGLLPDTLDFKFLVYVEPQDAVIDPDPYDMKPDEIAQKIAAEINMVDTMKPGQMRRLQMHTLKLGPDLWQSYSVNFNKAKRQVEVKVGPHVTMSGIPAFGTEPPADKAFAASKFNPKLTDTYGRPTDIKGFGGPSFGFLKRKDGAVEVVFIPFHRRSGHSMTIGVVCALLAWLLTGVWTVGAVIFFAWGMHLVLDTFGHLGNNLFWPLTKQRTSGLYLVSASNPYWNSFTIYSCIALVFWNMNLYNAGISASYTVPWMTSLGPALYLLFIVAIPWAIIGTIYYTYRKRAKAEKPYELFARATEAAEAIAESPGPIEQEHYYEIDEKPRPSLMWRLFGVGVLIVIFLVLFILGPTW
jgi:membrane-bound metal-dependent hydrolase YbcI (DUF457 family)